MTLDRLYVVTGLQWVSDLWVTFSTKVPLEVEIQKYAMGGG